MTLAWASVLPDVAFLVAEVTPTPTPTPVEPTPTPTPTPAPVEAVDLSGLTEQLHGIAGQIDTLTWALLAFGMLAVLLLAIIAVKALS